MTDCTLPLVAARTAGLSTAFFCFTTVTFFVGGWLAVPFLGRAHADWGRRRGSFWSEKTEAFNGE